MRGCLGNGYVEEAPLAPYTVSRLLNLNLGEARDVPPASCLDVLRSVQKESCEPAFLLGKSSVGERTREPCAAPIYRLPKDTIGVRAAKASRIV